jgi:hypothetical protein
LSVTLMRSEANALEAEIHQLDGLGLDDLRKLCGPVLGAVLVNHGAHLLRRRLAYELQARALGDLTAATQRRLQRLHQSFKADPQHKLLPRKPLMPGIVLTRIWQVVLHQVQVTNQGFEYRGERFASLSEVASPAPDGRDLCSSA